MSNKIYNSPGVYTTEKELYYTSESLGVTTLGAVGETLKGPAFQPIFIKNYDEFRTMFGGTSPEKFKNTQIVKYELPYIAKSYLTQSNQLFVTRVLGLSGYNAGNATLIKTIGTPFIDTLSTGFTTETTIPITGLTTLISEEINIDDIATGATETIFYWGLINESRKTELESKTSLSGVTFTNIYHPAELIDKNLKNQEFANNEFETIGENDKIKFKGKSYFILPDSSDPTSVKLYEFTDTLEQNNEYKNNIVAVIRNRGKYNGETLEFNGDPTINFTDDVLKNPKGNFEIESNDGIYYEVSLDDSKKNFIKNVIGETNTDKNSEFYCEQVYNSLLNKGVSENKIYGLRHEGPTTELSNYESEFQTPVTPFFVTELRGGMVERLFRLISISDGSAANTEIKVSIFNIDPDKNLFDLGVRVFNDSDKAPIFLERFTNLSMNEASANYIGRKIGTIDNKYPLRSSYIIVEVDENAPIDAIPAGFEGYPFMNDAKQNIPYKTSYVTPKDKVKKVYLGFSDTEFGYDKDLLKFKGNSELTGLTPTLGFHLENSADLIEDETGNKIFTTPTNSNATLINLDNTDNPYKDIRARKFTTLFSGGFDGWDIYRNTRTNSDGYKIGGDEFKKGGFKMNTVPDFDEEITNTDYYAYLMGIKTFENPEKFVINVLVTPGIDIINNAELVRETIEIVEEKRKDSIYIPTIPDINVYKSDSGDVDNWVFPNDIVRELEGKEIDSNYTAVYYPWIQVSDIENNAYVYIPPTGEVCKNLAFTDNVAYPWFATAGYNRGIVNCIRTRIPLDLEKRDTLYLGRINPIATFTDIGNVIWGNKNLQIRDSALNRLNIRRLLLQAKKLIVSVSNRLLFDPNDTTIRSQFLTQVNPILDNIRKERGLIDFRVKLSEGADDTDRNTMRGQIFIKPTHSLEMIELEFTVTPTNVSFDDI